MKIKILPTVVALFLAFTLNAQTLPSYVATGGLKGFWLFTQNANDISGNNYNGVVTGAALTSDRFGASNSAYNFNGTSDYILTNYMGIMGDSARAVSFWAAVDISQTQDMEAVGWGVESPGTRFSCSFNLINNNFVPSTSAANCISGFTPDAPISTTVWHHYVFQAGAGSTIGQVEIYQDAVLMTNPTTSQNVALTTLINTGMGNNVTFGRIWNPNQTAYFKGRMDDIGIWNRTLTQCEISRLYYADGNTGKITFSAPSYQGALMNLAQYTQTLSGNSQFSIPVAGSSFSGTGVTLGSGQYNFNSPPTLPPGTYTITHTYNLRGGCVETKTATLSINGGPTGIGDHLDNKIPANLFPNPAQSHFYISTDFENELLDMEIKDMSGKIISSGSVISGNENPIDISQLNNGLYILEIKDKKNNFGYKKLFIAR